MAVAAPAVSTEPHTRLGQVRAAAAAAGAFLVVALIVAVATDVVGVVYTQGQTLESVDGFEYTAPALGQALPYELWRLAPMAAGVFVSFWLTLPVRARHGVGTVIARSLVAVLVGLAVAVAVEAVRVVSGDLPVRPTLDDGTVDNRYYMVVLGGLTDYAWRLFADTFALVVAVGLAAWGTLRTRGTVEEADPVPGPAAI